MDEKQIYIIANPCHSLGFLVMTEYEPIGFDDSVQALSILEQLRKQEGDHLELYQVIPVIEPLVLKLELETFNQSKGVKDFDYSLIKEYLKEGK